METLREEERDLTLRIKQLERELKQKRKRLTEVLRQIKENDITEIQEELEQENVELIDHGLDGQHWETPTGKRKRIYYIEHEINKEYTERINTEVDEIQGIPNMKKKRKNNQEQEKGKKVQIIDLLEELSEEEIIKIKNMEDNRIMENETIPFLFNKICKNKKEMKRNNLLEWYDFAQRLQEEIRQIKERDILLEDKAIMGQFYDQIQEHYTDYSRNTIQKRVERARKIYRIFSQTGEREKIKRIKNTNIKKFSEITIEQITEWEKELVTSIIEEETMTENNEIIE